MPPTTFSAVLLLAASCCFSCSLAVIDLDEHDLVVAKLVRAEETLVHSYSLQPVAPYLALFKLGHIGNLWAEVDVHTERPFRLITVVVEVDTDRVFVDEEYSRLDAVFSDSADKEAPFFNVSKQWRASMKPALEQESKQKGCCKLAANFVAGVKFKTAKMVYWFEPEDKDREWAMRKNGTHRWVMTASPAGNGSGRVDRIGCPEIRVSTRVHWDEGLAWTQELRAVVERHHEEAQEAKRRAMPKTPKPKPKLVLWLWKVGAVICCLCLLLCVWYWCFYRRRGGDEGSGDGSSLALNESNEMELGPLASEGAGGGRSPAAAEGERRRRASSLPSFEALSGPGPSAQRPSL